MKSTREVHVCSAMRFLILGLMFTILTTTTAWAKISKCGTGNCRNMCLEYETENIKVGDSQLYTVVGGIQPFQVFYSQNAGYVRVEWINPRVFRVTGTASTEGFGIGPAQFQAAETGGQHCGTGAALLNIFKSKTPLPTPDKPPIQEPAVSYDISGTWRHGQTETWTFTRSGSNTYRAQERGFGNASGTATVTGKMIRIDYMTQDGKIKGYYEVNLSGDGNSADGRYVDSQPASGAIQMARVSSASPANQGNILPPNGVTRDLNGMWDCSAENITSQCYAIFFQEGSQLTVISTYPYQGRTIVWSGSGSFQGNEVRVRFHHTSNTVPKDWQDGVLELTLSPDKNMLSGISKTVSGNWSGKIQFNRR
jgi:hypothetical protein